MPEDVKLPKGVRVLQAIFKNWKETIGGAAILFTLYLWYFDRISQEKALFGIVLLIAGGFINNVDIIAVLRHIGNYKKQPDDTE